MQNPRLASRYAKSLIDLSIEQNSVDAIYQDMLGLKDLFLQNTDVVSLVKSPVVKADKKQSIFKAILGEQVNPLTIAYINLLTNKGREYFFPEIVNAFIAQYKELKNITTVTLTTATPLDPAIQDSILSKITSELKGKTIDLQTVVDEKLIGGFVLESNNNMFDASIARDLKDIQKQFAQNVYVNQIR
jgi:F-type H+-transporting ATPase subunit delta